ncbi:Carboxypeptidase D [Rhynchospora pubera]|uniref:Carboxypeptidase D n=1 Tax=Rhynchospora pubera TaxID=906938 RepID=A0AAV8CN02_9POAL|nr:Carboxypeptidase D [Rhynchospora pubera]
MDSTGRISVSVFVFALLSFFPFNAVARGGDRISSLSGPMNRSKGFLTRHLFEAKEPPLREEITQGYMSNFEMEKSIKEFGKRCANISYVYSIGESVQGFPLWVIEISDKPGKKEPEPSFKYIGNVHGDEPVGRELLMRLANWLCDSYMKDPLANLIVEKVHLHLLPSMNPDGFALRRRGNANNVDLNRDFPDQFFPINDVESMRQPETIAIMNWLKKEHFTASASLHGGALVANYPWDGSQDKRNKYYACPDDAAFQFMATVYSRSHYNMSLSKEFPGGIINGAFWYPIYGGMQDWNYIHGGCFEITLEISDIKWPKAKELDVLWEHNRMSMLTLIASLVKAGVHGRVFSGETGFPLPASVIVEGINYTVRASSIYGDYHRILAPRGSYKVIASMPGYQTKSTQIQIGDEGVNLDFILNPEESINKEAKPKKGCDCNCNCNCEGIGNTKLLQFFKRIHMELYIFAFLILLFLCFLFKRKSILKFSRHNRQYIGGKRSTVV